MNPGFPPWIALTLPAGLRFGRPAAGVAREISLGLVGGAGRDRTDDLRLAKAALSQLSYSPEGWWA